MKTKNYPRNIIFDYFSTKTEQLHLLYSNIFNVSLFMSHNPITKIFFELFSSFFHQKTGKLEHTRKLGIIHSKSMEINLS